MDGTQLQMDALKFKSEPPAHTVQPEAEDPREN